MDRANCSQKMPRARTSPEHPVTAYAKAVDTGSVIAGPHVRAACARHLRDLKHGAARGIQFDADLADRAIGFYRDVLKLNGGDFEGVAFELLPWQKFIVGSLFGWINARDGTRRFRVAFIEAGKGCGKSPLVAGLGLYGLVADGEARAEVYAAATKKDQAMVLFRDAVAMVDQSPALRSRIAKSGGAGSEWNLAYHTSGSFFRPISSDDGQSGPRPHVVLLDEIHEHKTAAVVEMLRAGTKGRRQALVVMITNSGNTKLSVCWDYHEYARQVAAGLLEDDSFFSYVCALDEGDDPLHDESCWIKANPSLDHGVPGLKYLREQTAAARGMPAKEAIVRRLNFCQWVEGAAPWIGAEPWLGAAAAIDLEALRGRRCYAGLDLSSTQDLTALSLLFEPESEGRPWLLASRFWLPAVGLADRAERDRVPYDVWARDGVLLTTPGKAIDKAAVLAELMQITAAFDVQAIAYDRWRINDLKLLADKEGIVLPLVEFGQGFKDMSPAVEEFERGLLNGQLAHDGNPVMTMCAANAVLASDPAGNRKPAKDRATGRIDGVVAAVMAVGASLAAEPTPEISLFTL